MLEPLEKIQELEKVIPLRKIVEAHSIGKANDLAQNVLQVEQRAPRQWTCLGLKNAVFIFS